MTGTYAAGAPWPHGSQACGFDLPREIGGWFARMTAGRGPRGHHPFSPWGLLGHQPPFGPPWAGGPGGWRPPKARRGDVRAAILAVLAERSRNGYQVIQEIAERSGGVWKPSPGSVYPTLQQLEDEGLVRIEEQAGRRLYSLTEEGRAYVTANAEEIAAPWQAMTAPEDDESLKPLIGQVAAAVWQLMAVGTAEQQAKGRAALIELRRTLYAILAEDDAESRS